MHAEMMEIHERFSTPTMLEMIHHPFNSQKNEALNKSVTKVAPKDKTFCGSMALQDRVAWVVLTDSVGKAKAYTMLLQELGLTSPSEVTSTYFTRCDRGNEYWQKRQSKREVNCKRARAKNEKIREGLLQQRKDAYAGLTYGCGVALDDPVVETAKVCKWCKRSDHLRKTSMKCPLNPKNVIAVTDEKEAEHNGMYISLTV
jgi:hypothetical protein